MLSSTRTSSFALKDEEHVVLMLPGVPREELGAMLEAQELRELKVSARDRPGTSRTEGGEMERLARW